MEFKILGTVEAVVAGQVVDLGVRRLERRLLGVLLLHLGSAVSSERLTDLVWDGDPPVNARRTLQVFVSRLRGRLVAVGRSGCEILGDPTGYLVNGDPDRVDAHRFRRLLDLARGAGDPAGQVGYLDEAARLWRGPVLGELSCDRIRAETAGWDEDHLSAAELRMAAHLALGHHDQVLGELGTLMERYPRAESLVELLVLALYRAGRRQEALDAYAAASRSLVDRTGLDARPQLELLHERILRDDPTLNQRPRLGGPAQLPPKVADYTGRGREIDVLDQLVANCDTTAVLVSTIDGTAGIGKTALAVHWAHRARHHFPDGQLYIDLRGYSDSPPTSPAVALARFLRALGIAAEQIPADVMEAGTLFRGLLADRRVLVVLDNANSADQVRPLLPGRPGSLALVTSRSRLAGLVAVDGMRNVTLDVLTTEESVALLARILGDQRVMAAPEDAVELVGLCGRLPLAIRISAALLAERPEHSLRTHVAALRDGDRFSALTIEEDEQSCVRASFDLSYRELEPEVARLFRLLGIVPGPDVTIGAAAALAQVSPARARHLLDRLAAAHLIQEHVPGRYSFHDLIRVYAHRQATVEDGQAQRAASTERLMAWYLEMARTATMRHYPTTILLPLQTTSLPSGQGTADDDRFEPLVWLDAEYPNLVAAIWHAAGHGPAEMTWLLTDALRNYFYNRRFPGDRLPVARAALAAADAAGDLLGQAASHLSIGQAYAAVGDTDSAISHYTEAATRARSTDWEGGLRTVLNNLGIAYKHSGRFTEAASSYREVIDLARRSGVAAVTAVANLGNIYLVQGRLQDAHASFSVALAAFTETGNAASLAAAHTNLGLANHGLGRYEEAAGHLREALRLNEFTGNNSGLSESLFCLGSIHRDTGDLDQARACAREALRIAEDSAIPGAEVDARNLLASTLLAAGDRAGALREYENAQAIGSREGIAETLLGLAATYASLDRPADAVGHAERALELSRTGGYRMTAGKALTALAKLHALLGRRDLAVDLAMEALDIQRESGHRLGEAQALMVLADTADGARARAHRRTATAILRELGVPERP
ncbi:SARP family transcriptional regulator [Longispora fulva]|uniref:Tetratricopeptide (TPR) repeat protein n=1 Tax=Longispora fulva TaxID=619741 RepID=A0A8J7KDT5_9ACTN|nr:tetratricopeptide repeat protein [Longispora fulva]MBG6134400.1 tetratricopeptide (TPR) repeat protein [Longispora fulva]GIG62683.1 SARP family transcriptional regulator [Longispora fulva]